MTWSICHSNISTSDEDDMRLHHDTKKDAIYEPVDKVLRKRITGEGVVQYYIYIWKIIRLRNIING